MAVISKWMIEVRDSRGHFARGNMPWNKRLDNKRSEDMASLRKLPRKVIGGGLLELERCQVICPACGQQVEAVAADGRVKGYCTVAEQYVDFPIETDGIHREKDNTEARAKISAAMKKRWQDPEYWAKQIATHAGRHLTTEVRTKMSAAHIGKHHTAETRAKISAHTGKHLTAEHKAKISAAITRWHNKKRVAD